MHRWVLSLLLVVAAFEAAAQPGMPPKFKPVYRVDTRPPSEMFKHGLQPHGLRTDVLAHAIGGSCDEDDPREASRWVSTTDDLQQALRLARVQLARGARVWLYTLRPDDHFFSVEWFVRQAQLEGRLGIPGSTYTLAHAETLDAILARSTILSDREVIAEHVAPENVRDAAVLRETASGVSIGFQTPNHHYRDLNTTINPGVHDLTPFLPPDSIDLGLYRNLNIPSCAMSCDGASTSASRLLASARSDDAVCLAYRVGALTPVKQLLLFD